MAIYVDKIEFHNLLKEYRDLNNEIYDINEGTSLTKTVNDLPELESRRDRVYNKIGKRFLKIAKNYLNKPFYINYSDDWKDDMISEAVYDMIRYIDNYNVDIMQERLDSGGVPDPFAYFTTYVFNGIMRFLGDKKKDKDFLVRLPFLENMDRSVYE